jgi:hypothetical protein
MHSIGNFHDAQTILHWVRSHPMKYGRPTCVMDEVAPDGWEFLGRGSYRSVWLSPEGVAYKVGHEHYNGNQCLDEISNLKNAWAEPRRVPDGCRLPRFEGFSVNGDLVVAIEKINGVVLDSYRGVDREKYREIAQAVERAFRLWDMHGENCMVEDGTGHLVPVDFGG